MKLFELFATISLDDKQFTDGVKRATAAGKQMAGGFETISAKAVALGNVMSTLGIKAAQMAGNFAKTSIEAAAQVQAEKAQFEAAFGEMAGFATKALKNVQGETGILYTRLRTVGTKAFSQLKGAGLGAADAMEAMEKYTGLAADAAAYYDISLEEADAKLRSFMRGNTEAGDAIGLFTSETQRNERAVEKYGKKWLQLTEAQKQMLMLDIAGGIYEQSGAIGQAARESDSWANIIGNLDSAWTNFIAKFGDPIKEAVIPIFQTAIDWLNKPETQTTIEQAGLGVANAITALFDGEDSPVQNLIDAVKSVISFVGSEEGQSIVTAVSSVGLFLWALDHPLQALIATIGIIIADWDTVSAKINRAIRKMKEFLGIDQPTAAETGEPTMAEIIASAAQNGDLSGLTREQREAVYGDSVLSDVLGIDGQVYDAPIGPTQTGGVLNYATTEDEDVSYGNIIGYAKGLSYVPYDNYIARLHRGEEVLTAAEARQRRSGQGADISALYSAVAAAVRDGVSRIAINMDGQRVGRAVAGSVSREQARMTNNDLRAGGYVMA